MSDFIVLEDVLNKLHNVKCAVIGDFMLDEYIYGDVTRISPESPVPILKYSNEKSVPGGAGNVVANLVGLDVSVCTFGRIGDDDYGKLMLGLPLMKNADNSHLCKSGQTIVKTRVLGGGRQQMLRIDREDTIPPDHDQIDSILHALAIAKGLDCVVISDYGKGFCSQELCYGVIEICCNRGIKVFVDPKCKDWTRYEKSFLITPNMKELSLVVGDDVPNEDESVVASGRKLLWQYNIENLIVTRSDKGATLITRSGFNHCPAKPVEVFDVSGAGDTMIAAVAAFSAAGVPLEACVRIANTASQIVIGKVGTYPIMAKDLSIALCGCSSLHNDKVMDIQTAKMVCANWKSEGMRLIFTNGCFDILHAGHVDSLRKAKRLGDRLVVGLNSDDSVRRLKGKNRPVNAQEARAEVLAALECVDMVVIFNEDTPAELISQLSPNVIAKGGDYTPSEVAGREYVDKVVILPLVEGYSTSSIIEKMHGNE